LVMGAEDLAGFAEMVELPALASLCQSVLAHLNAQPHQLRPIAELAIAAWRRTQAMVLIGQTGNLPIEIELPGSGIPSMSDSNTWSEPVADFNIPAAIGIHEAETVSESDFMAISEAETISTEQVRIVSEAETIPEWGTLDFQDFTIAQPATISELGGSEVLSGESAIPFLPIHLANLAPLQLLFQQLLTVAN
jgi:hypothetical protein